MSELPNQDPAIQWLATAWQNTHAAGGVNLWFSDENTEGFMPATLACGNTLFISNRYDIAQTLIAAGHAGQFSDFDTQALEAGSVDRIFYRISKEKPVVHYLLNQAQRLLRPGGELLLAGLKNEGAKTFLEKAAGQLGAAKTTRKHGLAYTAVITRAANALPAPLDDSDYERLRKITTASPTRFVSKPGLFGWQKEDAGSALLIDALGSLDLPQTPASLLDLGCGYGYLALRACLEHLPTQPQKIVLTDNNAAALIAARHNAAAAGINADIIAADAGSGITPGFDLLLCNPPFHQGFSVSGDLTDKFLTQAARLTKPQGTAVFVVNSFIPLQQKAAGRFAHSKLLADTPQFKVFALRHSA